MRYGEEGKRAPNGPLECSRYRLQSRSRRLRIVLFERIQDLMTWMRERWHPGCHSRKRLQCSAQGRARSCDLLALRSQWRVFRPRHIGRAYISS